MKKVTSENDKLTKYVAFLRGINVGGNNLIKMDDLKKIFESLGFKNVKTILASGNVVFETAKIKIPDLTKLISGKLEKTLGYGIGIIVRSIEDIRKLANTDVFKNITVTPQTRLYVTFLPEKSNSNLKIPYVSHDNNYKILRSSETEVFSVLTVSPTVNTTDLMSVLDKEFGKKVTTRNWNTIEKILK